MQQNEFVERYQAEEPLLDAWGAFVTQSVVADLGVALEGETTPQHFLRIPPLHRKKTVDSLVEKGYYRGKIYTDPYAEITDKVGTRFVVLLLKDIRRVEEVIKSSRLWVAEKARDFEDERAADPTLFDYQSVHYIVRCAPGVSDGEINFPLDLPCEIQIRTLMQHAFSELTHDTVYKPGGVRNVDVRRDIAKSMALIETTDSLFDEVSVTLEQASSTADRWLRELDGLYKEVVGRQPVVSRWANALLLNALESEIGALQIEQLRAFVIKAEVAKYVQERASQQFLYRQPTILLVYYLADTRRIDLVRKWPYTRDELAPVYTDLGHSIGEV